LVAAFISAGIVPAADATGVAMTLGPVHPTAKGLPERECRNPRAKRLVETRKRSPRPRTFKTT
jgi:hypothetical protein